MKTFAWNPEKNELLKKETGSRISNCNYFVNFTPPRFIRPHLFSMHLRLHPQWCGCPRPDVHN